MPTPAARSDSPSSAVRSARRKGARVRLWADTGEFVGAAIRGRAVNLRVTPRLKAKPGAAYLAWHTGTNRARLRGPLPGSTYYARLGRGEWAIATFSHPVTGTTDQPEVFNRPIGGRWVDIGGTGDPCPAVPRPVVLA